MSTLVLGSEPVIEEWLDRRRALGQDTRDEVWESVHHVAPPEHARSGALAMQLLLLLAAPAAEAGLVPGGSFNLGAGSNDFRVPDLGFHRRGVDLQLHMPTAALVVEVLSPDHETFAKFGFYAARGVQELWVVDPLEHTVRCWQLRDGGYEPAEASALLGLRMDAVAAELDWP